MISNVAPTPSTRADPEAPGTLSKGQKVLSRQAEPLKCYGPPKTTDIGIFQARPATDAVFDRNSNHIYPL